MYSARTIRIIVCFIFGAMNLGASAANSQTPDRGQSKDAAKPAQLKTESMIGPLQEPTQLFAKIHQSPSTTFELAAPVRLSSAPVPEVYLWRTPAFEHRPLYFEQPNLERYGVGTYRLFQPAAASAHFFTSAALMPYKLLTQHPYEHVWTLGHHRPGNCAPWQGRTLIGQSAVGEVFCPSN